MLKTLIERYPVLKDSKADIKAAAEKIIDCYEKGGKLILCGNGGSSSDCDHIVGELMKSFMLERKPQKEFAQALKEQFGDKTDEVVSSLQRGIPAISLPAHSAVLTAYLNDVKPEYVYAQLTYGYGKKEDLLIGLSTSGNSGNVVNAVKVAKTMGLKTAAITGAKDRKLSALCDT